MKPYWQNSAGTIFHGDVLEVLRDLPDKSVHCCVTSPPYWGLRDYGVDGQIGLEKTPDEFVARMVEVFGEVRRVLRGDGTLWLNLGDSYALSGSAPPRPDHSGNKRLGTYGKQAASAACQGPARSVPVGLKAKDLCGISWRVAFALQADGWYLRQDIIWHKPNPMPESVRDRCTKAHEYLFLMSKSQRYHYDCDAVREQRTSDEDSRTFRCGCYVNGDTGNGTTGKRQVVGNRRVKTEPLHGTHGTMGHDGKGMRMHEKWNNPKGRNKRSVWTVATKPFKAAHFATFPPDLIQPCILAGCPEGGTVLDPFFGSGTTGVVAHQLDRKFIGIELNKSYLDDIAVPRIEAETAQLKLFA